MKLLIVGLGSMGKRRARLTKGIDAAIQIVGVDTAESRRDEALRLGLADAAYATIGEAVAARAPRRRAGLHRAASPRGGHRRAAGPRPARLYRAESGQ